MVVTTVTSARLNSGMVAKKLFVMPVNNQDISAWIAHPIRKLKLRVSKVLEGSRAITRAKVLYVTHVRKRDIRKSNECPYKNSSLSFKYFKNEAKSLKKVWVHAKKEYILEGEVIGIPAKLLLDSGAGISVVPRNSILESSINDNDVERVRPYCVTEPFRWPTVLVSFKVGDLTWDGRVAVAATDMPMQKRSFMLLTSVVASIVSYMPYMLLGKKLLRSIERRPTVWQRKMRLRKGR